MRMLESLYNAALLHTAFETIYPSDYTKPVVVQYKSTFTIAQRKKRQKLNRISNRSRAINRLAAIFIGILLMCNINAQKVVKDASGNYHADTTKTPTGKTYTDLSGKVNILYTTDNGKLYYIHVSKTSGKQYRSYLKIEPKL